MAFVLIIFITFSVITAVMLSKTSVSLQKQQINAAENYRNQAANQIKRWLEARETSIKNHAMHIENMSIDYINSKEMTVFINRIINTDINLIDILIFDSNGNIINSIEGSRKINLSQREYFIDGMKGKSTITGFYRSAIDSSPIIAIAEPVFQGDKPEYIVVGIISHKRVAQVVESLDFGDWGYAYLIDKEGILLSDTQFIMNYMDKYNMSKNNEYKIHSYAIEQIKKENIGAAIYNSFAGIKVIGAFEWFEPLKVGLIVEFIDSKVMDPINSMGKFIWVFALYVMMGGIMLAFLISRELVTPINMLINASENIVDKNYENSLKIKTGSELDILIDKFNKMQSAIHSRELLLEKKNQELRVQRARAEEANRLKSQFLANMSHELRTPLNSIIGFTSRVIKKSGNLLPQIQFENLNIVKNEAHHLLELINDLLDYSKIEAGRMEIHNEDFDLREVLNEVSNMVTPLLEDKPIKYQNFYYTEEKIRIISDKIKIRQILINLISNAIKYSENGIVSLSIDKVEDRYRIRVKDDGVGIAEENLKNIFDEFRQIDGTYTRKVGGTGLGLSITKKFTEMLGGTIEVESKLGKGSVFTVYLPLDCMTIATKYGDEDCIVCSNGRALKKIVCIDDDINVHKLYRQYINEDEYDIISLNGHGDVMQKISEIMPDIILLDIMLPNKDGWKILSELKDNIITQKIPVIMISVLNEKNLAYKLKADEYLIKPIAQEELMEAIRKFEGKREQ